MKVLPGNTFMDLVAGAIYMIQNEQPYTATLDHTLLQCAGAINRQLWKSFGNDDPSNLTDSVAYDAYRNEVARVIHGWPKTVDFVRPLAFIDASQKIQGKLSYLGLCEPPVPFTHFQLPTVLDDPEVCVTVWDKNSTPLFMCPQTLRHLALQSIVSPMTLIHPDDLALVKRDRRRVIDGEVVRDSVYRGTGNAGTAEFHVELARLAEDDDWNVMGQLWVWRLVYANVDSTLRDRELVLA